MQELEATEALPLDAIKVENRHRKDLGDLTGLQESMTKLGLLHPVVVTNGSRLVAGQRRLESARALGWTEVPVRHIERLSEAKTLLGAENDENTCRKDMIPSEKVTLGLALEELERPSAAERKNMIAARD